MLSSKLQGGRIKLHGSKSFGRGWSSHCSEGNANSFWSMQRIVRFFNGLWFSPDNDFDKFNCSIKNIITLTTSMTCHWTRLPWTNPPISRARLIIACPWYFLRPLIFSILPAQFFFDDALVSLVADRKPLLHAASASFCAWREVWQLPVISFVVGWVRRKRVFEANAEILVPSFKYDLKDKFKENYL